MREELEKKETTNDGRSFSFSRFMFFCTIKILCCWVLDGWASRTTLGRKEKEREAIPLRRMMKIYSARLLN